MWHICVHIARFKHQEVSQADAILEPIAQKIGEAKASKLWPAWDSKKVKPDVEGFDKRNMTEYPFISLVS